MTEAQDALGLHIYGMEKDGDPLPSPSKTPEIDPDTAPGYLVSPVSVYPELVADEIDNRRVKMNVTIPAWVKELAVERLEQLPRAGSCYSRRCACAASESQACITPPPAHV